MSLLEYNKTYVPTHPHYVELTKKHEKIHWGEWEVKLDSDIDDWRLGRVSPQEKQFISSILRLFTQSDVTVGEDYYENLIPWIKNNEARNMLGSFAAREGVHQRAYALLNDTLGKGEEFYLEFLEYKQMSDKIEWMITSSKDIPALIKSVAHQTLAEGVMLFASFAMLLNLQRFGVMMGMGDVNQWSIRDESVHIEGLTRLFRDLAAEFPQFIDDKFKLSIYELAREVVKLEDAFIDLVFDSGDSRGITREEVKQYIRSVTDYRMKQLGLKEQFNVDNPFDWLQWLTSPNSVENFFENNTANYSKDSMTGSYKGGY